MGNEHYVYKYQQGNDVIYIGKTDSNLAVRILGHAQEPNFLPYLLDCNIYCAKLANSTETDVMEKLLINKYKPILNIASKMPGMTGFGFEEPDWRPYSEYVNSKPRINSEATETNKLKSRIKRHEGYLEELQQELRKRQWDRDMCYVIRDYLIASPVLPDTYVENNTTGTAEEALLPLIPCSMDFADWGHILFERVNTRQTENGVVQTYYFCKSLIDGKRVQHFFVEHFDEIVEEKNKVIQGVETKIATKWSVIAELQERLSQSEQNT